MVRSLRVLLVALAAAAITGHAHAQTYTGVRVSPYSLSLQSASSTGMQGMATYQATAAQTAANTRFYSRAVTFSNTTIANGVKSRFALGPAVALSAAMLGLGYVLDSAFNISTADNLTGYNPLPTGVASWCASGCGYASPDAAARDVYPGSTVSNRGWFDKATITSWGCPCGDSGGYVFWQVNSSGQHMASIFVFPSYTANATHYTSATDPKASVVYNSPDKGGPVSDDNVAAMVKNDPATWPEWVSNPDGSPRVLTPMPQQMTDVQAQYRIDTGLTPLPSGTAEPLPAPQATPTTSPLPTTAPLPDGSTVAPPNGSTTPTPSAVTFPVFCTWASKVCEFFDWMKVDPPSDTTYLGPLDPPTVDLGSTAVAWDSGLGTGTCPAPASVTVLGQAHEMTFQPVCDLAVGGRIFVLISATLGAGLLLMRVFV